LTIKLHAPYTESALDSMFVAFPFGKPVSTFPGNALKHSSRTGGGVIAELGGPVRGLSTDPMCPYGRHCCLLLTILKFFEPGMKVCVPIRLTAGAAAAGENPWRRAGMPLDG
jgi:hypothetical protein